MAPEEVSELLVSDAPLVLIEAPGGCGKTYQGAKSAATIAASLEFGKVLILTHTHAACAAFEKATRGSLARVDIRTIDSLVIQIATSYHLALGLPKDPAAWVRHQRDGDGYQLLAKRVALLLSRNRFISEAMVAHYPYVFADEHQDASADQHSVIMALAHSGAKVRVFGDPMQSIYAKTLADRSASRNRWAALKAASSFAKLQYPFRWDTGSPELGKWVLDARTALEAGRQIDLRGDLPRGLTVLYADNEAQHPNGYSLPKDGRRALDDIVQSRERLLILTPTNKMVKVLAAFWRRRIPIWEGHTRPALDLLVTRISANEEDATSIADAAVAFIQDTTVGFGNSTHGNRLRKEVAEGCTRKTRGTPAYLQQLAQFIVDTPNHRGVAGMLSLLKQLQNERVSGFDLKVDNLQEYRDAVRLAEYDDVQEGLAEITRRRTFRRPAPPAKSISTIHKAKGLETEHVLLIPCDARITDTEYSRCRLYVALSRAKTSLTLIVSRSSPSPVFKT